MFQDRVIHIFISNPRATGVAGMFPVAGIFAPEIKVVYKELTNPAFTRDVAASENI
jgi:hypothetical protein